MFQRATEGRSEIGAIFVLVLYDLTAVTGYGGRQALVVGVSFSALGIAADGVSLSSLGEA